MDQLLDIVEEDFHVIGICWPPPTITLVKNNFRNVPERMILSWTYPTDAPVGVEQYFFDD
jgi:hypothetical protein